MGVNAFGLPELDILLQEDCGDKCSCVIAFFGLITDTLFLLSYMSAVEQLRCFYAN